MEVGRLVETDNSGPSGPEPELIVCGSFNRVDERMFEPIVLVVDPASVLIQPSKTSHESAPYAVILPD
jgi:hypothetical protein